MVMRWCIEQGLCCGNLRLGQFVELPVGVLQVVCMSEGFCRRVDLLIFYMLWSQSQCSNSSLSKNCSASSGGVILIFTVKSTDG